MNIPAPKAELAILVPPCLPAALACKILRAWLESDIERSPLAAPRMDPRRRFLSCPSTAAAEGFAMRSTRRRMSRFSLPLMPKVPHPSCKGLSNIVLLLGGR